jgi:serine/threonine protein kinase
MFQDNMLSAKSDIWAIGCVLYEMITGKSPNSMLLFDAKSKAQLRNLMFHLNHMVLEETGQWGTGKLQHYQSLLHMVKVTQINSQTSLFIKNRL